jgi:hypothetical protein
MAEDFARALIELDEPGRGFLGRGSFQNSPPARLIVADRTRIEMTR